MVELFEINIGKDLDIKDEIMKYVLEKGWESAYVIGAIGSVKDVRLTTPCSYDLPPKITTNEFNLPAEILSFTGEILKREKMDPLLEKAYPDKNIPLFIHIHASVAVSGGHVFGGGFQTGKTLRALRVFIKPLNS